MNTKIISFAVASAVAAFSTLAFAEPRTVTFEVSNMSCSLCPITVKQAIKRVPGVLDAQVDYPSKSATVRYESNETNAEAIAAATGNAGYPSRPVKVAQ